MLPSPSFRPANNTFPLPIACTGVPTGHRKYTPVIDAWSIPEGLNRRRERLNFSEREDLAQLLELSIFGSTVRLAVAK
jgi:hypothetical protein